MEPPRPEAAPEATPSDDAPGRRPFPRRLLMALMFVVGLLAGGSGAAFVAWQRALEPFGVPGEIHDVTIPRGASARDVGVLLERDGVARHRLVIPLLVRLRGVTIKAGDYTFTTPVRPDEVLAALERGAPPPFRRVTVPEGLRLDQVAELVQWNDLGGCDEFLALAADPAPIRDIDPAALDLEGYLFPDTYHLSKDATAADLVRAMVERFRAVLAAETADSPLPLPVRQWVTLASLVEEETPLDEERPLVASVYVNRLRRGMLLQCDPTIIYALVLAGQSAREPRSADLTFDHLYNTYLHPGLPPGPISSPSWASLRAARSPADTAYVYFVASGNGGHVFSRSLAEHNRAVGKYRRVRREQRLAARADGPEG